MCGRFVGSYDTSRLLREIGAAFPASDLGHDGPVSSSWNVAPTTEIPALVVRDGALVLAPFHWGLVPSWARDASRAASMINARIETAEEKPSFRGLVHSRRCIVPMNGFYEWDRSAPGRKIPYYVTRRDGKLLLVAGVWTTSPALGGVDSLAMFTEESGGPLAVVHHRAPVQVEAGDAARWLGTPDAPLGDLVAAARPELTVTRVSSRVNSVRNNDPSLVDPDAGDGGIEPPGPQPTLF